MKGPFIVVALLFSISLFSQTRPQVSAIRISEEIKIDAMGNEPIWSTIPIATNFRQNGPDPGEPASFKSEVKFAYDDDAIYVYAEMHDPFPDSIYNNITRRDFRRNVDWLAIVFDTYKDGNNAFVFGVTAAGVQWDQRLSVNDGDDSWNAVYETKTEITSSGWNAEMRIPYAALRFSEADVQSWGMNMGRNIERKRELVNWSYVDPEIEGFVNQSGTLDGLENIKAPVRLVLFPFLANTVGWQHDKENDPINQVSNSFSGGMDLKFGINEAFTLDMTLIPDFSQARSDNQVLNLSAFEQRFDEQRQFFTEGVELFNKGRVFFSRRIGNKMIYRDDIEDSLADDESYLENPRSAQLINATKVSGRTDGGTGIGVLNAVSKASYAVIENEAGQKRTELLNPLTNYNVIVVDQNLKNNSYASIINTNVWRDGDAYEANVTAGDVQFRNKENSLQASARGAFSQVFYQDNPERGYTYRIGLNKTSGKLIYGLSHSVESEEYNPNDLGFLFNNNSREYGLSAEFRDFEPKGLFNRKKFEINLNYERLFSPNEYFQFTINQFNFVMTKNFTAFGLWQEIQPFGAHDYFDPRTEDLSIYYDRPGYHVAGLFTSTNYSKKYAIDAEIRRATFFTQDRHNFGWTFEQRLRIGKKSLLITETDYQRVNKNVGYVSADSESIGFNSLLDDEVLMGTRDIRTVENLISYDYSFTPNLNINFRLRHLWTGVEYFQIETLSEKGVLSENLYSGRNELGDPIHNINFNTFNIDLVGTWRFAPGSDLIFVWKNAITDFDETLQYDYFSNLDKTWKAPQFNSFSIKAIYFLDYLTAKNALRAKSS